MSLPRYNLEFVPVDGEEKQLLWQSQKQVVALFLSMKNGDDLVIHRTDSDAEPGCLYP